MSGDRAHVSLVVPRLDVKPWGGRKLANYGLDLPPEMPIGEALVTAGDALITAGDGAGGTLQDMIAEDPAASLGERALSAVSGRDLFPLLVKIIDAAENLSIQVHPDDTGARSLDRLGKTEAWYVLDAEPGAKLYLGLRDDVSLDRFMAKARELNGSSAGALRAVEAEPGMTILIPAGTIHALGAGVTVYEIQQPSDVTFRLDDWGRTDAQGNPREMHLEQGYAASRAPNRPSSISPIDVSEGDVTRQLLTACRYFALERIQLAAGASVRCADAGSPQVLTVLSGDGKLSGGTSAVDLTPGSSGVVWPGDEATIMTATNACEVLRAWVPDLVRDIIVPARNAGASDTAIAALGGASDDLRRALES